MAIDNGAMVDGLTCEAVTEDEDGDVSEMVSEMVSEAGGEG